MTNRHRRMAAAGAACAVVLAWSVTVAREPQSSPAANVDEGNDYTRSVTRPYAQVLADLQEAAKAQGFRVSSVHDIAASLRKEGLEREPYATVEVCKSSLAQEVLKAEPRMGTLMPCRIAVYQQGGQTVVSMVLPSRLMRLFPTNPQVAQAARQVDQAMRLMVDAATAAR